jgi:alkylation response protein AidB-like acyl-CoA dehydrogenase
MSIKKNISNYFYNYIQKSMPPISETEKEAIHAGDTWIDSNLFQGNMDWDSLIKDEHNTLSKEETEFLNNQVKSLCEMINDYEINEEGDLPTEIWSYLKKEKFFSMIIPKSYGGLEFSSYANSTIVAKIASVSCAVAVTVMVPNSLGPGELLMKYGTEEQKNKWLPRLSSGQEIPCFALTAPAAGSDAGAIPDKGIVCEKEINGEKVLGIELNFNKRYITLAPVSTLMGLAFKMFDPDNLIGDKKELGITCALIPTNHEGIDNSYKHLPMNIAFMNGPIFGENVFIPLDWIIGGQKMAGKGWKMLVECLSAGRGISLPALSSATAQTVYKTTSAYSYIRKQFGTSIGRFEGVEEALSRIAGLNYIIESTRRLTTHSLDIGFHPSVITAITKYHTTEMARQCVNDSMDIHAGKGIIQGKGNYLRNGYLGMPIAITVEGANILTRNLMIFGQGSLRCHPYLLDEMEALEIENKEESKDKFEELFYKHLKHTATQSTKGFLHGLSLGIFEGSPKNTKYKKYYKKLNRMSRALSISSDFALLVLGGNLKRKEYLSSRLGDMLSYLYMSAAVLKYAEKENTQADYDHASWAIEYLLHKMSVSFDEFLNNFPSKIVSIKIKTLTYPFDLNFRMPEHKLNQKLIKHMFDGNEDSFRNKISHLCVTEGKHNPVTKVEEAFVSVYNNVELEAKITKAQRAGLLEKTTIISEVLDEAVLKEIITNEEKEKLLVSEKLRWEVINVDYIKK